MKISNTLMGISLAAFLAAGISTAQADWATMNADIGQTNFVVGDLNEPAGHCSGTLISLKEKLVLTNNHCVTSSIDMVEHDETGPSGKVESVKREVFKDMELRQKVYKDFEPTGSSMLQAKIVAHSAKYDLALLQIKADTIPQTTYSHVLPKSGAVARGDQVFVVGNPYMLDANLTKGIISSTTRTLHWDEDNSDIPYYGVDAAVNPGNSGGALYNADGVLIGVPGAGIRGATGLGFAIPVTLIRKILTENCYENVWNEAPGVADHAACEQKKLDDENAVRAKAGLPPKKGEQKDSLGAGDVLRKAVTLQIKKPGALGALLQFTQ